MFSWVHWYVSVSKSIDFVMIYRKLFINQTNSLFSHSPPNTGAQEYGEAAAYIQAQFEAKNKSTTKEVSVLHDEGQLATL